MKLDKEFWQRKGWMVGTFCISMVFFGYGYLWVGKAKQVPIPEKSAVPQQVIPDYRPGDSLLDLKIERDRERSEDLEQVKEILSQGGISNGVQEQAEQELWRLTRAIAQEHELENLLAAKGYQDCLVTVGAKLVTVVITETLRQQQARVIGEMVAEVAAVNPGQIQIVERE